MKTPCTLLALCSGLLLAASVQAAPNAEAQKLRQEAHDLRVKAYGQHEDALKKIQAAADEEVGADHEYAKARALERKADQVDKVSAAKMAATVMREKAHLDERAANSAVASAHNQNQRAARYEKMAHDAQTVIGELKSKNANPVEIKLLEDDANSDNGNATASRNEAKRLEGVAHALRDTAKKLLAEADKVDPEGKALVVKVTHFQAHPAPKK
jgi:hypothetical protein